MALLEQAANIVRNMPVKKSCGQCKHYDHLGSCNLVGKYVPKEVVEVGCEAYEYDKNAPPF